MNKFKEMFHYGKFEKRIIIVIIIHIIAAISWVLIEQYLNFSLFDNAVSDENIKLIIYLSIAMLVYIIIQRIEGIIECLLRHHLQRDFSDYARKDVFKKIICSKVRYFDNSNTGELLELAMNDSNNYATFFTQNGLVSIESFFAMLTYIILISFINIKLTLVIIICYLIGYSSVIVSNKKTFALIKEIRELNISITKWITEQVNGFEIIKAIKTEENRLNQMKKLLDEYTNQSNGLDKKIRSYNIIYDLFSLSAILLVTYIGGINIINGILTYGTLMIFINGVRQINNNCNTFIEHSRRLNSSLMSFLKILKFNNEFQAEEDNGKLELSKINSIELKNVNFSYNKEKQILKDINLKVGEQEKIAIIGRTGSGKTTLVNLLCRFYNLEDGKIEINGIDYKQYKRKDLRDQIGYVLQDVVIFEGNVYENINYANKEASKENIENICKRLNLHEKIISLEEGYETNLNKNKDLLSQGEKQMINFARILVENPSMIILDEVTSSLSYENEELIKHAINEIMKGRICFIIAHRLSTIKNCDKILLMKDGKIIEEGNHDELIEQKGEYYSLVSV